MIYNRASKISRSSINPHIYYESVLPIEDPIKLSQNKEIITLLYDHIILYYLLNNLKYKI